jgi:hypothetical protein
MIGEVSHIVPLGEERNSEFYFLRGVLIGGVRGLFLVILFFWCCFAHVVGEGFSSVHGDARVAGG